MKQSSAFLICFLAALSGRRILGAPVDGGPKDFCADGSPNGAQVERGQFVYECRDGILVARACITAELKHIDIGQTTDKKFYRLACVDGGDNTIALVPTVCLQDGAEHKIDETWETSTNFYTCKRDGADLRIVNNGCIDGGRRVNLNEKSTKDAFVMVCNETVNNGARMMPTGCVKDGQEYAVGQSFETGKFWFNCTRTGREKVALKTAGCVGNGKRLNDGDRFTTSDDVIYECAIDAEKKEIRTVGCAERDESQNVIERRLGCTWTAGAAPFQYEWACQHDPATNSAKKVQLRCNYNVGGGVYNIEPGCYRLVDKAAFGCLSDASGLKLQSFQGDKAEQAASGAGLRAC